MISSIQTIIDKIPKNHIFDSHYIINELIKNYSDQYLKYIFNFSRHQADITLTVHGHIAQIIDSARGIKKMENLGRRIYTKDQVNVLVGKKFNTNIFHY